MGKKPVKYAVAVLLVALLLIPVGALLYLSRLEQDQYSATTAGGDIVLVERAYGDIEEVLLTDLYESIELSGRVVSTGYLYQELDIKSPHLLRLWVQSGDYLAAGDTIGICEGEAILSSTSGIISKISLGTDAYIEFYDLDTLALECYVTKDILKVLNRENLALTDKSGAAYEVVRLEDVPTNNGLYRALIRPVNGELALGASTGNLTMFTGRCYPDCIVVPQDCVYTLDGTNFYVRIVDIEGVFLSQRQVEPGETVGNLVCVSGVKPGEYCDSGYKAVAEGG